MKANGIQLIQIIEGTKQYLVPHFQRPYTWQRRNWDTLWGDLRDLCSNDPSSTAASTQRQHFMGAIVTAPADSVPEGVTKYLLIDGQQRLTTMLVLLAAIRDRARAGVDEKLGNQIHELYLTNRYQDGTDQYKLLPTQGDEPLHNDRTVFMAIVDGTHLTTASTLQLAYQHFSRLVRDSDPALLASLTNAILKRALVVSIVLERDDNEYAIFESLNAKGQPLSQADLLRNFFFMSIDARRHEHIYRDKWMPMERTVGRENMEDYIRHYLLRDGALVKQTDVYFTLKANVERRGREHAEHVLDDLVKLSGHYARLLKPDLEDDIAVRARLHWIRRLRATVCYPFLLRVFEERAAGNITARDTVDILEVVENFLLRRQICGELRAELNKLFPVLYGNAGAFRSLVEGVREVLAARSYPSDEEFKSQLLRRKLYGGNAEANERTKYILERLESSWVTKEIVATGNMTIEHVLPQTPNDWWKKHLGDDWEETRELYGHTLGNLTLTAYNAELSNADLPRKCAILRENSRLSLNQSIAEATSWTREDIERRGAFLADRALLVWPNFAPGAAARRAQTVTGTSPRKLVILGEEHVVDRWQEVLRVTLDQVLMLGEDVIDSISQEFPRYVSKSQDGMRSPRMLGNGSYYESHLNAEQIHRLCLQVAQKAGLSADEWIVEHE